MTTLRLTIAPAPAELGDLGRSIEAGARAGLRAGAEVMATAARDSIGQEHPGEWPPLAESTIEAKTAAGHTGRVSATDPLLATGAIRASIGAAADADGDAIVVGSSDPKMIRHEIGTRHMPPRPVLARAARLHGEDVARAVAQGIAAAIEDALRRR